MRSSCSSLTVADRASTPYSRAAISSAVRSGTVAIRQCSAIVSPSNTPSTMLVLPMSIASSMPELQNHIVDQPGGADPGGDREDGGPAEVKVVSPNGGVAARVHQRQAVEAGRRAGGPG